MEPKDDGLIIGPGYHIEPTCIVGYRTAFPEVFHVPRIGGQNPGYIIKALEAYKSGERTHPSMRGIAASLTPEDMADLAAYYGEQQK